MTHGHRDLSAGASARFPRGCMSKVNNPMRPVHELWKEPPTESTRYGIYGRGPNGPALIAYTAKDGIGTALVQLAEDDDYPCEIRGVLDRIERKWITGLW